jgi:hypothetical protein
MSRSQQIIVNNIQINSGGATRNQEGSETGEYDFQQ